MVSISIVMPVYNGEKYLSESIESILNQTYTDFEFIIINDGSTDNSSLILRQYQNKDSRIKLIENKINLGIVKSLNIGLKNSLGEYIARMDADDISFPQRIELQVRYLIDNINVNIVGCFTQSLDSSGIMDDKLFHSAETHNEILWSLCFSNPIPHPGVMFRKSSILYVNGYREHYKHAEDYDLWVRLAKENTFYIIPKPLIILRKHEQNITTIHYQECLHNSISISRNLIVQLFQIEILNEVLYPLWGFQKNDNHLSFNSAKFFINITEDFISGFSVNKNEKNYIDRETIKKLASLINFPTNIFDSIKILCLMAKFNIFLTTIFVINKYFK